MNDGDQTKTDKLTGLIWAQNANLMRDRDSSTTATGTVTWQVALDYVKYLHSSS